MKTKSKKASYYLKNWPSNKGQNEFMFAIMNMRYFARGNLKYVANLIIYKPLKSYCAYTSSMDKCT